MNLPRAESGEQAELFQGWRQHPVTQEIFSLLRRRVQDRKDLWANGNLMGENAHITSINDAMNQGYVRACEDLLQVELGELTSE